MHWLESTVQKHAKDYLIYEMKLDPSNLAEEFYIPMGSTRKRADIVVFRSGMPHTIENIEAIIECKRSNGTNESKAVGQLKSYLAATPNSRMGYVVRQVSNKFQLKWIPVSKYIHSVQNQIRFEYKKETTFLSFVAESFNQDSSPSPANRYSLTNISDNTDKSLFNEIERLKSTMRTPSWFWRILIVIAAIFVLAICYVSIDEFLLVDSRFVEFEMLNSSQNFSLKNFTIKVFATAIAIVVICFLLLFILFMSILNFIIGFGWIGYLIILWTIVTMLFYFLRKRSRKGEKE